jgi:ABC-type uncharacterized transport system substrate-binding protein
MKISHFLVASAAIAMIAAPAVARAHPHVMVDANLEIVRNAAGDVTELRNVWRFDELFSTTVLMDYDANANNVLEPEELAEVAKTVTKSISEEDFFTEVRLGKETVEFVPPPEIMVDYVDGQILMLFAVAFAQPLKTSPEQFRVSIADPTYYVAFELAGEAAVQVSGNGAGCGVDVVVPDYDKLMSQDQASLTEQFFNNPENADLGDEWMTWVNLKCS